jgi:glycyl-tRNA synthetase
MTDVLKVDPSHVNYHEIEDGERAHYSARTIDVEYQYPFGMKELYGLANRTDYDLSRHQEATKQDLRWLNPDTNEKVLPYVIEPTWGLDRTVLVVLLEHLDVDEAPTSEDGAAAEPRMVLRLPPALAPVTAAVLPLTKKEGMPEKAQEVVAALQAKGIVVEYDESASIGKRYRRQDEIGTPWCVTVDGDTLSAGTVTVRDRDTMAQEHVPVAELAGWILGRL